MSAVEQLIENLNRLSVSVQTYSEYTHEDLIRQAFSTEGELSTIRSISFGVETVYPLDDKIIVEFPDVMITSTLDGGNGETHNDFFECDELRIIVDGTKINLCC